MTRVRALLLAVVAAVTLVLLSSTGAVAADGAIAHVEPSAGGLRVLVDVPAGVEVLLDQVEVTVDGAPAEASAALAGTTSLVRRTAVLAIDTSSSMAGARFEAARSAALAYLESVPANVYVGIVSFAGEVSPGLEPTTDRAAARAVIDDLTLSRQTRLYDGVLAAVAMAGTEGQRSLLVLSDGADTSGTDLDSVTAAISDAEVLVDVVALDKDRDAGQALEELAGAGTGRVIEATPQALSAAFAAEADTLARQVLVTTAVPDTVTGTEATVAVTLSTATGPLTAEAFTTVRDPAATDAAAEGPLAAPDSSGGSLPGWVRWAGVAAFGAGLVLLLVLLVPRRPGPVSVEDRLARYTGGPDTTTQQHRPDAEQALTQAKEAAAQVLRRNKDLEARISLRLDGAGSSLKPSEWLLVHTAVFLLAGLVGLLLGRGSLVVGILFLLLGAIGPWIYLGFRRGRRRRAFNAHLPETLQLMSGSLSAGLSLAQSADTIVREGTEPVASEFRRVLVETRLGVSLEDALDGVAERFESKDFAWVVMAIRIQRQVGGNLAELLDTVAATMREREYMRRQVAALSAEGKLSAVVLGLLPPLFLLYLIVAQRDYVMPLFTDLRGIVMLGLAGLLLTVGIFWMSKLVKVEV